MDKNKIPESVNGYKLIQMTNKDIKKLKEQILKENNYICPVSKLKVTIDDVALDHIHPDYAKRYYDIGNREQGLVRGVLEHRVNSFEGKVTNSFYRMGLHNLGLKLPEVLRNLADYIEAGAECAYVSEIDGELCKFVHPSELPPTPVIQKESFRKLIKKLQEIGYPNKLPEYKSKQSLTKQLQKLYDLAGMTPEFYKM